MWKKSLSSNCLQGKNLICSVTALSPPNENVYREMLLPPSFREWFLLNPVSPLAPSLENGANRGCERVNAGSFHTLFSICYSRGKGYLTLNTTCHQSQLPRILYKLKDSVNALTKLDHLTLSLHFHFYLSRECKD